LSESWMQEICPSSLMSGIWKRRHGQLIRHRQPKGSETVKAEPTSTASDLDSTLSRGLPLCLTLHRQPPEILVWARFMPMVYWGDVAREGFAESPGSGIYLRRGSPGYAGVQNLRPVFTRPRAGASPLTSSAHPNFPLCDLRGLCGMLSPRRMLLAREPARRR
jgi:hypothetical protein